MGALLVGFSTFLAGLFGSLVTFLGGVMASEAILKFLTFGAKVTFLLGLMSLVVTFVTPLAGSLSLDLLPQHAQWVATELDLGYVVGVLLAAVVFRFGIGWLGKLL